MFYKIGYMYEKYNAFTVGLGGGGGEYVPQVGFGWTNGVALVLLNSSIIFVPVNDDTQDTDKASTLLLILLLSICGSVVGGGILFFIFLQCLKRYAPSYYASGKFYCSKIFFYCYCCRKQNSNFSSLEGTPYQGAIEKTSGGRKSQSKKSMRHSKSAPDELLANLAISDSERISEYSAAYF
jgi:hypothetical protein